MKIKVYFIIASILQIILAITSIVTSDCIAQSQITDLQEISNVLPEIKAYITDFAMTSNQIRIISSVNIILNIIACVIVAKDGVLKRKGVLIVINVWYMLTALNILSTWIAVITIIILSCVENKDKKNKKKFNTKEAEARLKLETVKMDKKRKILTLIFLTIYFLQLIPVSFWPDSIIFIISFIITIYISLLILAIVIFWQEIKHGFKVIIKNSGIYFKYILRVLGIMFIFYFAATIIIAFAANELDYTNQKTLEMLPIIIVAPAAIIWAPIVEEVLYRGIIRKLIKNNTIYIIISSVSFGAMHVISEGTLGGAILTAIPYAILGSAFSYIYCKTNNIACNIIAHSLYNTIGVLFMLLG